MSVTNPQAANAATTALTADRRITTETHGELEQTRQQLESPTDPLPDDNAPATTAEADGGSDAFVMTEDRRVGAMALSIEGHGSVRFGKPSGRASTQILAPIERMEDDGGSLTELSEYVWSTLAEWSLDEERDTDHWADEHGLFDAISTVRNLALGGNNPGL